MKKDTFVAAAFEAGLLCLAGLLAFYFQAPLIFSSLGPTAYELVETPERPSARPFSVLVGHGIGIVAGLLALLITHAAAAPAVSLDRVAAPRILAVVVAAFLTVVGTLTVKANQPAALSTTLLIALGNMQTQRAVMSISASVILLTLLGEPIRRLRLKALNRTPAP